MALLTPQQIAERLKSVDGWSVDGKAIRKEYKFQDFPEIDRAEFFPIDIAQLKINPAQAAFLDRPAELTD